MPTISLQSYLSGTIVTFGKHRGSDLSDVPIDYLRWALRDLSDAPEEFHKAVRNELHRRLHEGVGSLFGDEGEETPK